MATSKRTRLSTDRNPSPTPGKRKPRAARVPASTPSTTPTHPLVEDARVVLRGLADALRRDQPELVAIYAHALHELASDPDGLAALLAARAIRNVKDAPGLIGTVAGKAARLAGLVK